MLKIAVQLRRETKFLLLASLLFIAGSVAQDKKLAIYSSQGSSSFPVVDRNGAEYVILADILNQYGKTTAKQSGTKLRLKFAPRSGPTVESEFNQNSPAAKIGGRKVDLGSPFLVSSDRGLVPTSSLPQLMSSFLELPVSFHQTARRLFIGAVSNNFTYELQKNAPARLVLHFSAPVNPSVATEPGRIRLSFAKEPVVANTPNAALADSTFSSLTYSESNGGAEISIAATAPLQASFSDGGKTVTITSQPNAPATSIQKQSTLANSPNFSNVPVPMPTQPRFLVVIDAAHGGDDRGAAITPTLNEKDVALAFARRLRTALDNQGIAAVLLRDSDTSLSSDQRVTSANTYHASLIVSIHATSSSSAVHLYTALLSPIPRTTFLPWETAQAAFLDQSLATADAISKQLTVRRIENAALSASLRPLSSFARPAVAIELAPYGDKAESLILLSYQQPIVSAVAAGIGEMRSTLESSR